MKKLTDNIYCNTCGKRMIFVNAYQSKLTKGSLICRDCFEKELPIWMGKLRKEKS